MSSQLLPVHSDRPPIFLCLEEKHLIAQNDDKGRQEKVLTVAKPLCHWGKPLRVARIHSWCLQARGAGEGEEPSKQKKASSRLEQLGTGQQLGDAGREGTVAAGRPHNHFSCTSLQLLGAVVCCAECLNTFFKWTHGQGHNSLMEAALWPPPQMCCPGWCTPSPP